MEPVAIEMIVNAWRRHGVALTACLCFATTSSAVAQGISSESCAAVVNSGYAGVSFSIAEWIAAGRFAPPVSVTSESLERTYNRLPALCRLVGTYGFGDETPRSFEVWLPDGWNGDRLGIAGESKLDGSTPPFSGREQFDAIGRGVGVFAIHPLNQGSEHSVLDQFGDDFLQSLAEAGEVERVFLGTTGTIGGGFAGGMRSPILQPGPGQIQGRILRNGRPLSGLSVRLALNNTHWSAWSVTDSSGVYSIPVPEGEHSVVGYQFAASSANELLAGLIDHPENRVYRDPFVVTSSSPGNGPSFRYINPVVLRAPVGEVSISEAQLITWDAYPGADSYRVSIRQTREDSFITTGGDLLGNGAREYRRTELVLADFGAKLSLGQRYMVEILALDTNGDPISMTPRYAAGPWFRIGR